MSSSDKDINEATASPKQKSKWYTQ